MSEPISDSWLTIHRGTTPLVLSFPHAGLDIPDDCARALVSVELALQDTDWFVDRLYDFADELGATTVRTALARSVIDVNRDPSGASLYPGQATTGLVPMQTFDGRSLYSEGMAPDAAEVERRKRLYFAPYHAALVSELARLRDRHARVVLYDCHSIRSVIPRLFSGELAVFNIGTNSGNSCDARLEAEVARLTGASRWPSVVNGRFTGGWITRHYGRPAKGIHAVQMELAQHGYLPEESSRPCWDAEFARPIQSVLRRVLEACVAFADA